MPPAPPSPSPQRNKSVTFCSHCEYDKDNESDIDVRYYSDPGREAAKPKLTGKKDQDTDSDQRYYSEPDAKNYFEIDYEFLKELRRIARNNCPKCRRKRSRKTTDKDRPRTSKKTETRKDSTKEKRDKSQVKYKEKSKSKQRSVRVKENYVYCNGRYHSDKEHCQLCCRVCNRSTDTLDSIDDEYSLVSKSYTSKTATSRSQNRTPQKTRERKNSIQSIKSVQSVKSVSFLESGTEDKDETNYTAKSFTNDLKKFLLRPSTPRLSFRDKFMISIKQELEATKKSPKLKAIKGLWKSY